MVRTIFLRLLYSYLRHRWLYLLPIVFLTIAGCYYMVTAKRYYISSGVVYTEQTTMLASLTSVANEGFSWNTPAQEIANQFSDLVQTDAFLRAVIKETDLETEMDKGEPMVAETITEVRKRIWVIIAGTNQIQVNASNTDPRIAYQMAQATISTFIQWRMNKDRIDSETASKFFQELIKEYRADVQNAQQALRKYIETHPEPVRGNRPELEQFEMQNLQADLDFAGKRLADALTKAENARLGESQLNSINLQKYTVIDAPDLPEKPATSRRQLAMNAGIFLAAGIVLSAIAVIGATVLDQSFRIPQDINTVLNVPVLAVIPEISGAVKGKRPDQQGRKSPLPMQGDQLYIGDPDQTPLAVDRQHLQVDMDIKKEQHVKNI